VLGREAHEAGPGVRIAQARQQAQIATADERLDGEAEKAARHRRPTQAGAAAEVERGLEVRVDALRRDQPVDEASTLSRSAASAASALASAAAGRARPSCTAARLVSVEARRGARPSEAC